MASLKLSNSPGINSSNGLSRTKEILINTMQLVEPRKPHSRHVPNHLLESKLYSKLSQNATIQVRPAVVHFAGFQVGKVARQTLHLGNMSSEVQSMHIIPPQTRFFKIKYTKASHLVPGLTLDCSIEFIPDEWRYYYDCIYIHTGDKENLVVPIHAYPVLSTDEFPSNLHFPPVPIGHTVSQVIPLRCSAPIDFEFHIQYLQSHPAFVVDPMSGIIPANSEVDIKVTFSPSEYCTAQIKVQLRVSQFNAKPLVCTITGLSTPGLTMLSETEGLTTTLDPRAITPVERARNRRLKQAVKKPKSYNALEVKSLEAKLGHLDTPYGVAQVLNQEPGKLRIADIKDAILDKKITEKKGGAEVSRQIKEAMFDMAVRKEVYEERQNQLRWQVKTGADHMSSEARQQVLAARQEAWAQYKQQRGDPNTDEEYRRPKVKCSSHRTVLDAARKGREDVKFDVYSNNMWVVRHAALNRFKQAARKIIICQRADRNIKGLKDMVVQWGKKQFAIDANAQQMEKLATYAEKTEEVRLLTLNADKIRTVVFPVFTPPNAKDDMAVDAHGLVSTKPTEVFIKKKTPYYELKVPQHYKLLGYTPHSVQYASYSYVPPALARPLRTGAEDEIIILPSKPDMETGGKQEDEASKEGGTTKATTPETSPAASLKPPQAMFQPTEYPPLHIFNPAPGLQVYQPMLPYAETDADFHLCPLPQYPSNNTTNPHKVTQRKYLDREDVVKGVMNWKKFPSQGLTSLANTPTLTNIWVPRWNDCFSSDMLPQEVPPLFDGLPDADKEVIQQEDSTDESDSLQLTPEMVNARFPVNLSHTATIPEKPNKEENFPYGNSIPLTNVPVSSTGPVPREQREKELEYFLNKKCNGLGKKFQEKISTRDNLKINRDLVLK